MVIRAAVAALATRRRAGAGIRTDHGDAEKDDRSAGAAGARARDDAGAACMAIAGSRESCAALHGTRWSGLEQCKQQAEAEEIRGWGQTGGRWIASVCVAFSSLLPFGARGSEVRWKPGKRAVWKLRGVHGDPSLAIPFVWTPSPLGAPPTDRWTTSCFGSMSF